MFPRYVTLASGDPLPQRMFGSFVNSTTPRGRFHEHKDDPVVISDIEKSRDALCLARLQSTAVSDEHLSDKFCLVGVCLDRLR